MSRANYCLIALTMHVYCYKCPGNPAMHHTNETPQSRLTLYSINAHYYTQHRQAWNRHLFISCTFQFLSSFSGFVINFVSWYLSWLTSLWYSDDRKSTDESAQCISCMSLYIAANHKAQHCYSTVVVCGVGVYCTYIPGSDHVP